VPEQVAAERHRSHASELLWEALRQNPAKSSCNPGLPRGEQDEAEGPRQRIGDHPRAALSRPADHGLLFSTWSLSKLADLLVASDRLKRRLYFLHEATQARFDSAEASPRRAAQGDSEAAPRTVLVEPASSSARIQYSKMAAHRPPSEALESLEPAMAESGQLGSLGPQPLRVGAGRENRRHAGRSARGSAEEVSTLQPASAPRPPAAPPVR
jgi:hypothetical protein